MSVSGQSRKNNLAAVETGSSPLSVGQLAVKGWRLFCSRPRVFGTVLSLCMMKVEVEHPLECLQGSIVAIDNRARFMADLGAKRNSLPHGNQ